MKRTHIVLIALVVLSLVASGGVAAWFLASAAHESTGSMVNKPYKPTSVWIEEGLDPNVTNFGFGGKETNQKVAQLSDADVYNLVQGKHATLMPCYANALAEDDELQGKVDMQFGIAPDGHIAMVKVTRSSLRSKQTEDCFVQSARKWSFPKTGRGTLMKFDTDFTFVYE